MYVLTIFFVFQGLFSLLIAVLISVFVVLTWFFKAFTQLHDHHAKETNKAEAATDGEKHASFFYVDSLVISHNFICIGP